MLSSLLAVYLWEVDLFLTKDLPAVDLRPGDLVSANNLSAGEGNLSAAVDHF